MEYVPGRPLSAVIEEEEISLSRALEIVRQLLCTLKAAHDSGVVHADLKSDNIIVETTADGDAITLIDFGLARVDGRWDPGWETGCVSGTPAYMAPELVRGEPPTVAADLYGVGVILYELLTGRTPFEGGRLEEVLQRQLEDDPLPPSQLRPGRGIPEVLDRCVLRALHKDPAERFTSAVELLRVLSVARRALGEPLDLASSGDEPRGLRERVAEVRPRPALRTSDAPTSLDLPHVRHRELRRAS